MFVLSPALNTFPVVALFSVYKTKKSINITYSWEVNTSVVSTEDFPQCVDVYVVKYLVDQKK